MNRQSSIVVHQLVSWFSKNKRPMPWRLTRDPYRIWLSEVMLQQTQVATVIPYYERFLARFPTVRDLASAELDEVLKFWAGLGYYSRARNLHRGARVIMSEFGGEMPRNAGAILEVPGIGAYTAGAVLSIAFGMPEALVDGNVARVLSRLFLIEGDWHRPPAKTAIWDKARELVAACAAGGCDPGDFNQALMELGATVCTPRSPDCRLCPLAAHCRARKTARQHLYPTAIEKAVVPVWKLRAWIIRDGKGRMLFARRGEDGLFSGLWEWPTERIVSKSTVKPVARIEHVLTHRALKIEACAAKEKFSPKTFTCWSGNYTKYRWLKAAAALKGDEIGLSSLQRKLIRAAMNRLKLESGS